MDTGGAPSGIERPAEAGRRHALRVFTYATTDKAELYIAIVDAMVAAKQRFRLQMRPSDVLAALPSTGMDAGVPALEEVAAALESLCEWGNLTHFYDTAAPETLQEFYARRFLYQLAPAGEAAHAGVEAVRRSAWAGAGRLSAVLLPGIIERLHALAVEASPEDGGVPDAAKVYRSLVDLFGAFTQLADNAGTYMSDLAQETSAVANDDARFEAYKRAVLAYLDDFVARLDDYVPPIRELIRRLEPSIGSIVELAVSADQAPTLDGADHALHDRFAAQWRGLTAWFLPADDEPSVAESLRLAMLEALNRILVAIGRLNDRYVRRVSREADFMQLARWFARLDDAGAAQLWDVTFGLYPSRHFVDACPDEEIDRGRSFWQAEPVEVAPRLRAAGTRASPGRPGQAADYSATKLRRLAELREQQRQARAALVRLAGRTPAKLSDLGLLDADEFGQLLAVIDAALAMPPGDVPAGHSAPVRDAGARRAVTPAVTVELRPIDDAPIVAVHTAHGDLHVADRWLDIRPAGVTSAGADERSLRSHTTGAVG